MKGIERLAVIRHKSKMKPDWKHSDLFRILRKEDLWVTAYENIKSNPGSLTPGVTPETLDGMTSERLERLRQKVIQEIYQFQPVKEIQILKPDGRKRPIGLVTANDKIVQEVLRMILEAVYEPCFSEQSFGFRRGLGAHDALDFVEQKFRWVDWVIEGDIEKAYPTLDHHRLYEIIGKKIDDPRFLNCIRKSLKGGVSRNQEIEFSDRGVPQGSLLSPLLANIYYHEMDQWVENKKKIWDQPGLPQRNQKYKQLSYQIGKISKELKQLEKRSDRYKILLKELKLRKKEREETPSLKNQRIQIEYVRYADDWMIGIKGEKKLVHQIKREMDEFLKGELKQNLHSGKTKILDLRAGKASFLGYEIYLPQKRRISPYIGSGTRTTRRTNSMLRFDLPVDRILQRMKKRGYLQKTEKGYFPTSLKVYTGLEDPVIVKHFQKVWTGIENYYSGCTNLQKLQYLQYLLRMSCAMTLAHRHRTSSKKIFAKWGKDLRVQERIAFPVRTSWSIQSRKWLRSRTFKDPFQIYANRVSRSSLQQPCLVCGSETKIEMHHVKHIRKNGVRYGGFQKEMSLLNRKQIPLCRNCHQKVHQGRYDGIKLTKKQNVE